MERSILKQSSFFLFVLFFLISIDAKAQQISWENLFAKSDKQFIKGKYQKAIDKNNKKVRKTIQKKYANNAAYLAWLMLYEAKVREAQGILGESNELLVKAREDLKNIKASNLEAFTTGACREADVALDLGRYRQVQAQLTPLKEEWTSRSATDDLLMAELDLRLLQAKAHIGDLNEVIAALPDLIEKFAGFKAQSNGPQGKLSKYDLLYRNVLHGRALSLMGEAYSLKGEYASADSLLNLHEKSLSATAKSYPYYARHLIIKGNNSFEAGDYRNAEKYYENVMGKLKPFQREYMLAYKKAILTYFNREKDTKFDKGIDEWSDLAFAFSKGNNYYQLEGNYLEAQRAMLLQNYDQAKEKLLAINAEASQYLPQEHPLKIRARRSLYEIHLNEESRNLDEALNSLDKNLKSIAELYGDNSLEYKFAQILKGDYYLNVAEDYETARSFFKDEPFKALFEQRSPNHRDQIKTSNVVADFYDLDDQYAEGLKLAQDAALGIKNKFGEESAEYGLQLVKVADLMIKVGRYKEAEENMNVALKNIRKDGSKNSLEYAGALSTIAKIYGIFGLYDEARKVLRRSDRIYKKIGIEDMSQRAQSIEELAFLYIRLGEYAETEEILNILLEEKSQKFGAENRRLIQPLNQLGLLELIKGDYSKCSGFLSRAEVISKKIYGDQTIRTADNYKLQAEYYTTIGDYERAESYIDQVISIQQKVLGENHVALGQSYVQKALIKFYESTGNAESAIELLEKARQIMADNFDNRHPLYAEVLKTIGVIYVEQAKYDEAFTLLNEANEIWLEKLNDRNINSAFVYSLLGDIYANIKDFDQAEDNYKKAENIYKKRLSKSHPDYVRTESKMARMFYIKQDYKEANRIIEKTTQAYLDFIKTYFPALSEREKAKFWNKIKSDFEFFNSLAVVQLESKPNLLEKMYNYRLATKALLLSSSKRMRENILNGADEDLKETFLEWQKKKEAFTQILSMSEEQRLENEVNPQELSQEINQLEKELSEKSELFASNVSNEQFTWQDVREQLNDGEAAVEIIRYRKYEAGFSDQVQYAALIISPKTKKRPDLVLLSDGNKMEKRYITYYRRQMKFKGVDKYSYKIFWQPIEEALPEEIKIVFFSPDGVYNQLNPESFRIDKENYVIDRHNIRLLSNTKDLINYRRNKENNSQIPEGGLALLFGNPVFYTKPDLAREAQDSRDRGSGDYIEQLPGTAIEIEQIKELLRNKGLNVKTFTQDSAEENVLKELGKPVIIHIATHGFFQPDPPQKDVETDANLRALVQDPLRRSGLLTKGAGDLLAKEKNNYNAAAGILTADEASNANLEGVRLVVMSACETGLGEIAVGEGVYGLQRSFLVAGADALIMSLFKVDDEATQKLMTKFYTKWIETGNRREAFTEAQKEVREEYDSPRYWGVFNMIGVE